MDLDRNRKFVGPEADQLPLLGLPAQLANRWLSRSRPTNWVHQIYWIFQAAVLVLKKSFQWQRPLFNFRRSISRLFQADIQVLFEDKRIDEIFDMKV